MIELNWIVTTRDCIAVDDTGHALWLLRPIGVLSEVRKEKPLKTKDRSLKIKEPPLTTEDRLTSIEDRLRQINKIHAARKAAVPSRK